MCAAICARANGASVLVLEHAGEAFRGGNSRHTRNLRVMHESPTSQLVGSYLEEEFWEDLKRVTNGHTDEHLARVTIRGTTSAVPWMSQCGVRFQPSLTGTLSLSRTNLFFLGGGRALVNAYYATAKKMGIDILYDSEVEALEIDHGTVRSATITWRGFPATVKAKAFVAASGGFQANIDWLRKYWGNAADNFSIRGTPYAQGRILRNLLDQGVASAGDPTQCHAVAVDARSPKFDGGIVTRLDSIPFSIVVNRDAERFYDEGEDFWPRRYAIWGWLIAKQPGQIAYSIFDSKSAELFMPSVFPVIEAASIDELASKLGLDVAKLNSTIQTYNSAVQPAEFNPQTLDQSSTLGLTPPKTHWARKIDTPPYRAYPLRPGITFTYLGVKVTDRAQVLMDNGSPAKNLFASGEIMAGNILGRGYMAGFGMSIGTVFGRIAGQEAARYALN